MSSSAGEVAERIKARTPSVANKLSSTQWWPRRRGRRGNNGSFDSALQEVGYHIHDNSRIFGLRFEDRRFPAIGFGTRLGQMKRRGNCAPSKTGIVNLEMVMKADIKTELSPAVAPKVSRALRVFGDVIRRFFEAVSPPGENAKLAGSSR
jgi:hypothetical protein